MSSQEVEDAQYEVLVRKRVIINHEMLLPESGGVVCTCGWAYEGSDIREGELLHNDHCEGIVDSLMSMNRDPNYRLGRSKP